VETTAVPHSIGANSIATSFDAGEVSKALAWRTPCYLAVVDASVRLREDIYVAGISTTQRHGLYRIPRSQSLNNPVIRKLLFDEVNEHFENRTFLFVSGQISASNTDLP
jgi:hypothetical protein